MKNVAQKRGADAPGKQPRVSLRTAAAEDSLREMALAELTPALVLSAVPWRVIRSRRGQRHMPGLYWSSTTGTHIGYESRLELARLLLADMDRDVVAIAEQPFMVFDDTRRHVPDFLLGRADGSVVIVNVKPADKLAEPRIADALAWAGEVFATRGWEHEIWSGTDAQVLANVRFLSGYRRASLLHAPDIATARALPDRDLDVAGAEAALLGAGVSEPRPVVLHLLWSGALRTDLGRPLTSSSELEVSR